MACVVIFNIRLMTSTVRLSLTVLERDVWCVLLINIPIPLRFITQNLVQIFRCLLAANKKLNFVHHNFSKSPYTLSSFFDNTKKGIGNSRTTGEFVSLFHSISISIKEIKIVKRRNAVNCTFKALAWVWLTRNPSS